VSAGLRTTVILSPHFDGPEFLANTQALVRRLARDGALPTEWVVENYDHGRLGEASGEGNPVGSESEPNSVAGAALWVARNAPTFPSGACGPGGFGARDRPRVAQGGASHAAPASVDERGRRDGA
jgi:hypothetical protein